jgi:4-deoxy-L-threo-5-hexosulose-uronate ketol-isomerase
MKIKYSADQNSYKRMTNAELKDAFVITDLFEHGSLQLTYTDTDRAIVGSAVPTNAPLSLPTHKELAAAFFCERREVGVINIGSPGVITVDGTDYPMNNKDSLYIARGSEQVTFSSSNKNTPSKFYFVSYPAHRTTQTKHISKEQANALNMGTQAACNMRVIYQSICPNTVDSCQLVMGITELAEGNVWNTKPPHTHKRRTEVYMYFDIDSDNRIFHFMGKPYETRSIVMRSETAITSPSWSIHSGSGTSCYSFIWAMGGENQQFDDMDHLTMNDIG